MSSSEDWIRELTKFIVVEYVSLFPSYMKWDSHRVSWNNEIVVTRNGKSELEESRKLELLETMMSWLPEMIV